MRVPMPTLPSRISTSPLVTMWSHSTTSPGFSSSVPGAWRT
jgi:hypothetical protein